MPGPKLALTDMPGWPRMLTEREAAGYVRMSVTAFRDRIGDPWPEAIRMGQRKLYDRLAIDRAVDDLSRVPSESPTGKFRREKRHAGG